MGFAGGAAEATAGAVGLAAESAAAPNDTAGFAEGAEVAAAAGFEVAAAPGGAAAGTGFAAGFAEGTTGRLATGSSSSEEVDASPVSAVGVAWGSAFTTTGPATFATPLANWLPTSGVTAFAPPSLGLTPLAPAAVPVAKVVNTGSPFTTTAAGEGDMPKPRPEVDDLGVLVTAVPEGARPFAGGGTGRSESVEVSASASASAP